MNIDWAVFYVTLTGKILEMNYGAGTAQEPLLPLNYRLYHRIIF